MSCRLSVIVPTHDRPDPLARVVDCLTAQTRLPDEIVIVNDAADEIDPRIGEKIRAAGVEFQYCRPEVASAAASRNRGMAMATGDILFLVDDDMSPGEDCLMRLLDLYRTDTRGAVAGIGPMWADPPPQHPFRRRLWNLLAGAMGQRCWRPRVSAARYVSLPPGLAGKLVPAKELAGGAMSIRRRIAEHHRFEETFTGYTMGEDKEFSYRVGRRHPLFIATGITVIHDMHPAGRPDWFRMGRMYVSRGLHVAEKTVEPGAGTALLLAYDFVGMSILYFCWGVGARRGKNVRFAMGIAVELASQAAAAVRRAMRGGP